MLISKTEVETATLHETASAMSEGFPFRTALSDIQDYPCRFFPWHWHEEIEILYVVNGKLTVRFLSGALQLSEGEIVLIPSNILHSTEAVENYPGLHKEYIFSPIFLGGSWNSDIMKKYILPVLAKGFDFFVVRPDLPAYALISGLLDQAQEMALHEDDGFELCIRHALETVWMTIRSELEKAHTDAPAKSVQADRLYRMLQYIQDHFREDISLQDIAHAANISPRECSRCFQNSLHVTAMEYLLEYRIGHACKLLTGSSLSITSVGQSCGFSSGSYFAKRFHEKTGLSPKEYRASYAGS